MTSMTENMAALSKICKVGEYPVPVGHASLSIYCSIMDQLLKEEGALAHYFAVTMGGVDSIDETCIARTNELVQLLVELFCRGLDLVVFLYFCN